MADTYTTNLNLTKPEPGAAEDTWGISLNADLDALDAIFSSSGTQINLNPNQINFADGKKAVFGNSSDLEIYHDGSNSIINDNGTGTIRIQTGGSNQWEFNGVNFKGNDGRKIILGDSSDLQIYHDGSNSYIKENGTGNLYLQGTSLVLSNSVGANYLVAYDGGSVNLYHNANQKLKTTSTGIDVTGTVTSDALTVQTAQGDISIDNSSSTLNFARAGASYIRATNSLGHFNFITGANNFTNKRLQIASNGDISFYDDTGTTQGLFWDASAESLGIGTTSPSQTLDVAGNIGITGGDHQISFYAGSPTGYRLYRNSTTMVLRSDGSINMDASANFFVKTANVERMRITSSGELLLNKTSASVGTDGVQLRPSSYSGFSATSTTALFVNRNTDDGDVVEIGKNGVKVGSLSVASNDLNINGGTNHSGIRFQATGLYPLYNGNSADGTIDLGATGQRFKDLHLSGTGYFGTSVGIGTTNPAKQLHVYQPSGQTGIVLSRTNNIAGVNLQFSVDSSKTRLLSYGDALSFWTAATGSGTNASEKARFDALGNLLVGTTSIAPYASTSSTAQGIALRGDLGFIGVSRPNNSSAYFNRAGNDGSIIDLRKSGVSIGSIGTVGDDVTIGTGDTGLRFRDEFDAIQPHNITTNGTVNGVISLGKIGAAFKDLHLSGTAYMDKIGINVSTLDDGDLQIGDANASFNIAVAGARAKFGYNGSDSATIQGGNSKGIKFCVDNNVFGSGEAARIDSGGNLLVSTTSTTPWTNSANSSSDNGIALRNDGIITASAYKGTANSGNVAILNRTGTDGSILSFYRSGTTVGNIGCPDSVNGSQLVIAAGTNGTNTGVGLRFTSFTVHNIIPCYDDGSSADNHIDLGNSGARFDDIYATNGTINTSDRNEKQDIQALTDAEQRVATACKGLIRRFRWQDAVEEKGDDAR